jgi:hypothetical protein
MHHHNSLIHQLLKPVPWGAFERLVDKYEADKHVRALSTKSQFVALTHAQLSGAVVWRDKPARAILDKIEATMESHAGRLYHLGVSAPKRSTLADANRQRPADVFVELFQMLLAKAHPRLKRTTKEAVRLIDSTSMSLNNFSKDWASYESHGPGAKMHVVYDPNAATPVHFAITPQRDSDINAAKGMPIESGATYVFDLGYYDFDWWACPEDDKWGGHRAQMRPGIRRSPLFRTHISTSFPGFMRLWGSKARLTERSMSISTSLL